MHHGTATTRPGPVEAGCASRQCPSQDIAAGDVPLVRNRICWPGRPDIFRILETIKDRGAVIKPLDEPIIDTTSDNMWVEAFVTFVSAFAAIERKMILMRGRELKGDGERCYIDGEAQAPPLPEGTGSADAGGWPIAASGGTIARRGSPVEFSERPGFRGAFVLFGNPQRLHPVNNAKTGRQRSC